MTPVIKIQNLTKKFKDFVAVDDVSFSVLKGEIFGLLGPNGAGKTTTIRLLATMLTPTSGSAEVCGYDIIKSSEKVRANIGVLTTDIGCYDRFTGAENLRYSGSLYGLTGQSLESRISEVAKLLDMEDFLNRKAGKYSTGMKQKLAIARSVIHNPTVIIFDEPTSGLDVLASQTVLRFMKEMRELGKSVIFSTHHMIDAEKLCDKVAIMHMGKIVDIGSVNEIKTKTKTSDLEEAFLKIIKV